MSRRVVLRSGVVALCAATAVSLAGCTASSGGSTASSEAAPAAAASAAGSRGGGDSGVADSASTESLQSGTGVGASGSDLAADAARQIITTASAHLVSEDVAGTAGRIAVRVEGGGGRVEERSVQTPEGGPAFAQLVLRVPADRLSTTVDGLAQFGTVSDVNVTATDVTAQATDLDARIAALRTSTDRLTQLLAGAGSTEAVVAAESALTQRQAELDSLVQQRTLLAGQVQMATLSLSVEGRASAPEAGPSDFLDGLASGWRSLVSALGAALVVAGVLLPWLAAAAVVGALALAASRLARRARRARQPVAVASEPGAASDGDGES
ncbi:DUF4349 domain-containing protein [Quadrisphaera setariae]|uniref:DUF4349 domain-containing protein n=1 Tax=Quadrisphaera setariae TaxID=2593304 RepID=A0A5C8ZEQ7_9ACTN|nr:DUF4349 domain-containing protein [Quadrisphaera setariae]TXR55280.1 DUF4349 domain-containing protein [Quadrisphaera setariae]